MQTSEFLHFTSEFKYVNLDELNNAFSNFYNKYCDSSAIGRELFSFEYELKEFVNCMDYNIQKIKDNQYYPNFHALMEIDNFHNIIFKSLLKLFKTDDLILLGNLCCSIKIIISKYKHLFSYRLIKNPCHKDEIQQVKINDYERLLPNIFEYVKFRNDQITSEEKSIFGNYDNFDYNYEIITEFIKYSFHSENELAVYSEFLNTGLVLFNEKSQKRKIIKKDLLNFLKGEELKFKSESRISYFAQSERETFLKEIKNEVYFQLENRGLKSSFDEFQLIFDFDTNFYNHPLKFINPKNIQISFIIKFLIENKLISDRIRFLYRSTKTIKSSKYEIRHSFAQFSTTYNQSPLSADIDFNKISDDDKLFDYKEFKLKKLINLVNTYSKLS